MDNTENMKYLIEYLKSNGFKYEDDVDMSVAYFSKEYDDEEWIFSLTIPHEGNNNTWLWRAEKRDSFDKWINVYFEEKYLSTGHFVSYAIKEFKCLMKKYDEE